jgi:hypothetical protein
MLETGNGSRGISTLRIIVQVTTGSMYDTTTYDTRLVFTEAYEPDHIQSHYSCEINIVNHQLINK